MRLNLFIWISMLLALGLQVMPLPDPWLIWRPSWLGLMLAYWCLTKPSRVGVFHGFVFGLLLDLLEGTTFGHNAFLLSLLAYLVLLLYQRLRIYSVWQRAGMLVVVLGLIQLLDQWLRLVFGAQVLHIEFVYSAIIGGVLWPWWYTLIHLIQRRFTVG
ncbi:rod shape-determining protein MreD [Larsenimonas salina]|uniref:rod shape-determining protein MreD n=1 Tax=Larsenimonas salina TaxID=1295565 RepID=UPI002073B243|nr:rod shape-determining protein MreD [Larsenimonas salina]MCM5703097.1 rod shape-determining protein MreD [Larsenimonas salina]